MKVRCKRFVKKNAVRLKSSIGLMVLLSLSSAPAFASPIGVGIIPWNTGAPGNGNSYALKEGFDTVNGNSTNDGYYVNSLSVGYTARTLATYALAVGNQATVLLGATGGTALGTLATAGAPGGTALGAYATVDAQNALALGYGATAHDANSVALGTNSITAPTVATASATINGTSYSFAGAAPVGTVSVGGVGAERTITNVAAGSLSATSTDAVNGSQLYATNLALEALSTGASGPVQYANLVTPRTPNGGMVSDNVTLVGASGGPVTVENVAAGEVTATSTQAVNGSQLRNTAQSVADNFGGGSTVAADGSVTAPAYQVGGNTYNNVGSAFGAINNNLANLQSQISQNSKKASAGVSAAMAAAGLVQATTPGKSLLTAGVGFWQGESSLAVGASHRFSGGMSAWTVKASVAASASGNGTGGNVSVGWEF